MILKLVIFVPFLLVCAGFKYEVLTENFFENLQANPTLTDTAFSANSKRFIDSQIENYVRLLTQELKPVKRKRSLLDKYTKNDEGFYMLQGVNPTGAVPVLYPKDIQLFQKNSEWFAAALESPNNTQNSNNLIIFQYKNETFTELTRQSIVSGVKLSVISFENFTLIAVAENDAPKSAFHDKSGIYQFSDSRLFKIQSIDMHYASDIVLWRMHNEIYMSVAQFMSNMSGNIHYEIEIPIFKWLGRHFDLVQNVTGTGARKITPFSIRGVNFLAVANSRDDRGSSRVYSEIYKYEYHSEKYELYQRIVTRGCNDIKVFSFGNKREDTFLVVANSYETDSDGKINYETPSIIYKFVDDYFIPFQSFELNAVEEWLPVTGPNEFVLFASCRFQGLKSFQYDGWSFKQVPLQKLDFLGRGIKSIRSVFFNNSNTLVVSNGRTPNLFRLDFTHKRPLDEIYKEMMTWCDLGLQKVDSLTQGNLFEIVVGKGQRADIDEEKENEEIESKIDFLTSSLDELKLDPVELRPKEMIFENISVIDNLQADRINGFDTNELLGNVLDIDEGFELDEATFTSIEADLFVKNLNGHSVGTLGHNSDLVLDSLEIAGRLSVPEGIILEGELNGVFVSKQELLLRKGDQNFSQPLLVHDLFVERMRAEAMNGHKLSILKFWGEGPVINLDSIKNVTVTDLIVGGYVNDVDVPTLDKHSLKISGDQEITGDYSFDTLQGRNLEASDVSGRKLSHLIPIDSGNYTIKQDMMFASDIYVNNLEVGNSLNTINVTNGRLDILMKNQSKEQEITGVKTFDDVIIYHAITLQGHINSRNLEAMNPVVSIDDNLFLQGDKIITQRVQIENLVTAEDVVTSTGYSLSKLENEGLRLDSSEIEQHLYFVQQLNVDQVFVDEINGKNPRDFVVTDHEEPQIIKAPKIFLGDVNITGATRVLKINGVDVESLENQILKIEGDQTIVGKHHVKNVIVDSITSGSTIFDKNLTVVKTSETVSINRDVTASVVKAKSLIVKGLVNDLDFDQIIADTVLKNEDRLIEGHKHFQKLVIGDLEFDNGVKIDKIRQIRELNIKNPLDIRTVKIENIFFENQCNGVSFGKFGTDNNNVAEDREFDTLVVYGNAYIESNRINHVDIDYLVNESVKLDEPHEFNSVVFESVASRNLELGGHIEKLDFDNLVLSDEIDSTIFSEKSFENLTVNGSVKFDGSVNGVNLTQFCKFTGGEIENQNLTIEGDAFFAKGPNLAKINGVSVKKIKDGAWFSDEDAVLTGSVKLGDVVFKNDVTVGGFVDNVSLSLLYENYLSKSKDQNITATYSFKNDLIFENGVVVPKINMDGGEVNGVNLEEFVRTALLDDYDQVFENAAFFENCFVENLNGQFTVNDLDLEKDVMRFDKVNMVTGHKNFKNLNAEFLKLEKNIKIQEVDVLEWMKNSVLKTTDFNITGTKIFKGANFEKGFYLDGTLNGQKIDLDHVMVKDVPQEITGAKTITSKPLEPVVFKSLKLKGLINDVDVHDLINNQAYKNKNNAFKTSLNLYNNITTKNLVIKKLIHGVNMTELVTNVKDLGILNNLVAQFRELLVMSQKLKKSIEEQAYFVHHYKIVQTIPSATNSKKITCLDGTKLGILTSDDSGAKMDLYTFERTKFAINATIRFLAPPTYADHIFMGQYLYSEMGGMGHFIPLLDPSQETTIATNTTVLTESFVLPKTKEVCTLFVYESSPPKIYCLTENGITLKQTLPRPIYKACAIPVNEELYLAVTTQPCEGAESHTDLWRFNQSHFAMHQSTFEAHPIGVTSIVFKGVYYLAIASGHLQSAMYSGKVEIRRFDESTLQFVSWQSLELDAPIQVEFAILPSNELVLYVLTDSPIEPLLVFRYEGIAGFKLVVTGSALPEIKHLNLFRSGRVIAAQSYDEINVIQAVFKGEKVD